jgi:hypothetical protein
VNNANKKHLLIDIITITVCAVICGCGTWEEISYYGEEKKSWLKSFETDFSPSTKRRKRHRLVRIGLEVTTKGTKLKVVK